MAVLQPYIFLQFQIGSWRGGADRYKTVSTPDQERRKQGKRVPFFLGGGSERNFGIVFYRVLKPDVFKKHGAFQESCQILIVKIFVKFLLWSNFERKAH